MKERMNVFIRNAWNEPRHFFFWLALLSLAGFVAGGFIEAWFRELPPPSWVQTCAVAGAIGLAAVFVTGALGFLLAWIPPVRRRLSWLLQRRFFALACLLTLVALFYAVENWRGKRAWEQYKRELEAEGVVLDWEKFIPPPVPDDQNFFKAPNMHQWFVKPGGLLGPPSEPIPTGLDGLSTNALTVSVITEEAAAADYLKWSDQFQPSFDLIREALQRPYARMDGDYSLPYQIPVPNFAPARDLARVLAQRTKCCLLLGQPEQALRELTLLNDSRKMMEAAPSGKPMTLVASMINVAITGLYTDTLEHGLQSHAWREPQLTALQEQLKAIDLPPFLFESFREEPVYSACCLETTTPAALAELAYGHPPRNLWQKLTDPNYRLLKFLPRGWVYQNMKFAIWAGQKWNAGFDLTNHLIMPGKVEQGMSEVTEAAAHWVPWRIRLENAVPNFTKAFRITARNQTRVNQGQIVCALERYRIAHGEYPETLDALRPQLIAQLPHDIIDGQPLRYRRIDAPPTQASGAASSQFVLYSIGWNEKDDGGKAGKDSSDTEGDWVWR